MSLWSRNRSEGPVAKPARYLTRVVTALFLISPILPSQAATLWVSPANVNTGAAAGQWAVTERGQATFSFALPDDVAELLSAEIVVLPSANDEISYEVNLALTQEGFVGNDYTDVLVANNVELVGNQVVEIDISSVIPPVEMLVPGKDYLTVGFVAESIEDGGIAEAANVLGLRMEYTAGIPVSDPDGSSAAGGGSDTDTSGNSGVSRIANQQSDGSLPGTDESSPISATTQSTVVIAPKPDAQGPTGKSATPFTARPKALTGGAQFKTSGNASIGADLEVIGRLQSDDNSNTAVGTSSLLAITSGTANTAVGEDALAANTEGASNTAIGHRALSANDLGVQNTAIGNDTLMLNFGSAIPPVNRPQFPYGSNNTAIGFEALKSNTVGERNTAIGGLALTSNQGSLAPNEESRGSANTAVGYAALSANTSGFNNTAIGNRALQSNTTGTFNTAVGLDALNKNTDGDFDTAFGAFALEMNGSGSSNTAFGKEALNVNIGGSKNVAMGDNALDSNTSGNGNTALGADALSSNVSSEFNTAVGSDTLAANTGEKNTAVGDDALRRNTTGNQNTALGEDALAFNIVGNNNVAVGKGAGVNLAVNGGVTGNNNILVGTNAGNALTTSGNNIAIGNAGQAGDANTTRIGTPQTRTFIAGIRGAATDVADGIAVVIDSNGQLGTVSSSRRYKEQIQDMGGSSEGLLALRPVTYRYKADVQAGHRPTEFGLIAEEVAEVYPDLVAYDDGQPSTVRYHVLISMLLNELQREHRRNGEQEQLIHQLSARLARLESSTGN